MLLTVLAGIGALTVAVVGLSLWAWHGQPVPLEFNTLETPKTPPR